jgi:hypothetical protein
MKFHIRKGADLPELILEVQNKDIMYNLRDRLLNSVVSIDVFRDDACKQVISCGDVSLYEKTDCDDLNPYCGRLFLVYKFSKRFTSKEGIYYAKIRITFNDNGDTLILPTDENIQITVKD